MAYVQIGSTSVAGNVIICVLFGLVTVVQAPIYIYYGMLRLAIVMFLGTAMSCVGYAGRVWYHYAESQSPYIMQAVCVAIGPSLVIGGIKRLLIHYIMFMRLRQIDNDNKTKTDILSDSVLDNFFWIEKFNTLFTIVSSVLIGVGIGLLSNATTESDLNKDVIMTLAGFAIQLGLTGVFFLIWLIMFKKSLRHTDFSRKLKFYAAIMTLVLICALIRLSYRVAEWSKIHKQGMSNNLTYNEVFLLVLDGMTTLLACILLCVFNPGFVFGKETLFEIEAEQKKFSAEKKEKGMFNHAKRLIP